MRCERCRNLYEVSYDGIYIEYYCAKCNRRVTIGPDHTEDDEFYD